MPSLMLRFNFCGFPHCCSTTPKIPSFTSFQRPFGTFVHPSGVEKSLEECVNTLKKCHGDKKGKQFRVWVDQVLPTQIGSDSWLVSFKKWELCGEERQCCITTVLLSSKNVTVADGLTWTHVHQTWLHGAAAGDSSTWFI